MTRKAFHARLRAEVAAVRRRDAREAWTLLAVGLVFGLLYALLGHRGLLYVGLLAALLSGVLRAVFIGLGGRSKALDALARRGDEVVWVYVRVGASASREAALAFALEDGKTLVVPILPASGDALIAAASLAYPTATIGFSGVAQTGFDADPAGLRVPARAGALEAQAPTHDTAWLLPYAEAVLLKDRALGVLGALMAGLAGVGAIVAALAGHGTLRLALVSVLGLLAVAGGGLAVWGRRAFSSTPLHRALLTGDGLAEARLVEGPDGRGEVVPMAIVTLADGRRYTFTIPRQRP